MTLIVKCNKPSADCVTIDATSPNQALDYARLAFGKVGHDDLHTAVSNLLKCSSGAANKLMMVGHGKPGLIITGTGEKASDEDARISLGNFYIWKFELPRLQNHVSQLRFFSCDTAALPKGPRLLARVANTIGARVYGFTGIIFIDEQGNISCEDKAIWLYADPGAVVPEPPRLALVDISSMDIRLKHDGEVVTRQTSEISALRYFDSLVRKDMPNINLDGKQAQALASMINFAELSESSGVPLARVTGVIEIHFREESRFRKELELPTLRVFTVYNDRLLQDQSAPEAFYFASPEFSAALEESRSSD